MDSPPLRRFLSSVGRVQHHVYTAVVGLCGVEAGTVSKPADLDINWKATDLLGSSREARRFLLQATLVFVAEELGHYASQVLKFRGHQPVAERADRIRALGAVDPDYLGVGSLIVSHWRNRIIHRKSKARLTNNERELLVGRKATIASEFKHLDVEALLHQFDANQPTLKDVTVLLAMSIRFARLVDTTLPVPSTAKDVRSWLEVEDLLDDVVKLEKESRNGGSSDPRARAKQFLLTQAPCLAEAYYEHGAA